MVLDRIRLLLQLSGFDKLGLGLFLDLERHCDPHLLQRHHRISDWQRGSHG